MKINAGWRVQHLDNKCFDGFISVGTEYQYAGIPIVVCGLFVLALAVCYGKTFKDTKYPEHQKVMRGELRGEILVCDKPSGRAFLQI